MHCRRRHVANAGMPMIIVTPSEERLTESTRFIQRVAYSGERDRSFKSIVYGPRWRRRWWHASQLRAWLRPWRSASQAPQTIPSAPGPLVLPLASIRYHNPFSFVVTFLIIHRPRTISARLRFL